MKSKNFVVALLSTIILFEKIGKSVPINFCFSEIPKIFICIRVKQVAFLSEDWTELSVWISVLFTVFTLEIHEREAYRKQTVSNASVLLNRVSAWEHDRFMQVLRYTVS